MKLAAFALAAVPLLAACPKPRTSAATQPTPIAFDAAKSDPKAVEIVDSAITALGGAAAWDAIKELHFAITLRHDDKVLFQREHYWDRWNGRQYTVATDVATLGGNPDDVKAFTIKQHLFGDGVPYVAYGGGQLTRGDSAKQAKQAKTQLYSDSYYLAIAYKLKDPGVVLTVENPEIQMPPEIDACKPSCAVIKVTYEAGVGTNTWYIHFNNDSKLPEVLEEPRGAGRIGYRFKDWSEVAGLKFPGALQNIGMPGEVFTFSGVKTGEPDDMRYEVQVR